VLCWKMKVQMVIFWPLATCNFVVWHRQVVGTCSLFLLAWQNLLWADGEVITVTVWIDYVGGLEALWPITTRGKKRGNRAHCWSVGTVKWEVKKPGCRMHQWNLGCR
jgi:hypothetical protein